MRSRHRPPESLLFAEFCKKFPVLRRMSRGDRFVSDCAHHHPVSANPHVFDTKPNRAFPRGFPATHFSDLCLCVRLRVLVAIFGTLSLHPKIPFPATRLWRAVP